MPDSETTALRACVTIIEYSPPLTETPGTNAPPNPSRSSLTTLVIGSSWEKIAGDLHSQVADVATVKAFFPVSKARAPPIYFPCIQRRHTAAATN